MPLYLDSRYYLPNHARIRIEVRNVMGYKVATLVDGDMEIGLRQTTWNAAVGAMRLLPRLLACILS